MSKVVLLVLGLKGYCVVRAALRADLIGMLDCIVIGEDQNIDNDYSTSIRDLCIKHKLNYCFRKDLHVTRRIKKTIIALAAGWRWLIKEEYQHIIVFHDSLLPKYRGFNPLVTALLRHDEYIGVTAIIGNKEFDRGDIVGSKATKVSYPIKIASAIQAVSELYFQLAQDVFSIIKVGAVLPAVPQDDREASYSVWRDEEDYCINWSWSSGKILHFINCVGAPYKGASTVYDGKLIRILGAEGYQDVDVANRDVGKVLFVDAGKPVVICGSGLLKITDAVDENGDDVLPLKRFRVRLK